MKPGTAIATFPNGKYYGHAAIYVSQNEQGIQVLSLECLGLHCLQECNHTELISVLVCNTMQVWDQWVGQPVHQRTIRWKGTGKISNNGDAYHVIN